ncbi:pyrroloquinoline quinone biosynthesis protein PqqB [Rhodovulum sp. DZ06]|uniref:pyrroloquinoline quinone biosynthesis protein PqqB n=1 Tax=Rhodovulum sp. DZ06 TaxID=3425126 RepID=UPI003D347F1E
MKIIVLGAAAGGGLPQWNCGCPNCVAARLGRLPSLSQSSIAVSANGEDWAILNASPDIRAQMQATPALHPTGPRVSPLKAVLVTNGDIDHVAGLFTLRERQPFTLFATAGIHEVLAANPMMTAVAPDVVPRAPVALGVPFEIVAGVEAELFAVPGKVPLYQEGEVVDTQLEGENTVGVRLSANGKTAFYIPGCAALTPALAERIRGAALVMYDGTLFEDDEMIRMGLGVKTGARMGHMSMTASLSAFEGLGVARRVFVHMNNSNPALDPDSEARRVVEAAGWTVAQDGMEITP